MGPSSRTIEQVHKQPPQPRTTQLPSFPRHLPLPAARASRLPACPPAARPSPHKRSHKSPNICSATALERGLLPRSVETSSLEIFRRSSGGFFFFFQEKRGIFVRKHHHSIQGNNTPGTGGFHGQGSAGHVPQSHPQGPDLLRGHPEAAKPPVSRHQEATPGLGQTKLASDVPRGHRKGKYFSSVTFMGKSWKELQQGLGSTCVKAEQ